MKQRKTSFLFLLCLAFLFSCSKNSEINANQDEIIETAFLKNESLIRQFKNQVKFYYQGNSPSFSKINGFSNIPNPLNVNEKVKENVSIFYIEINNSIEKINEKTYYATFVKDRKGLSEEAFIVRIKKIDSVLYQVSYEQINGKKIAVFSIRNGKFQKNINSNVDTINIANTSTEVGESTPIDNLSDSPFGKCVSAHLNYMLNGTFEGAFLGVVCLVAGPECALVISTKCAYEAIFTNRWN